MLKQKQIEINSDILFNISIKLLDRYYIEQNIQFILLLSYLTVKEYSKVNEQLDKNAKIDLCIQYTPDLIIGLGQSNIMEISKAEELKNMFLTNINDMKNLLEVYYVVLSLKNDKIIKNNNCCFKY